VLGDLTRPGQSVECPPARARLEDKHERVVSRMRKESSQVRKEIVRGAEVVAATLGKLRMSQELRERDYDYVIVDEVPAA
jgi:hypothetical protein